MRRPPAEILDTASHTTNMDRATGAFLPGSGHARGLSVAPDTPKFLTMAQSTPGSVAHSSPVLA
jgi:hypothetical protein